MSTCIPLPARIARVAVPVPLYGTFDYLLPGTVPAADLKAGARLRVPFGNSNKIAYLVAVTDASACDPAALKEVIEIIDPEPLLQEADVRLLLWASRYYHYPLGEVFATAFPVSLRQGRPALASLPPTYRLTAVGAQTSLTAFPRAPKQRALLAYLQARAGAQFTGEQLRQWDAQYRPALLALMTKNIVQLAEAAPELTRQEPVAALTANAAQHAAIMAVTAALGRFAVFLLEGITGSGKTEVYMQIMHAALQRGQQVLVLLPEITLTPQLAARFQRRFARPVAVFHSGLSDLERHNAWLQMQQGQGAILLGTRSALFTPMPHLGLIILDEEHDTSFKQQEGFRFSARDVAVLRGRYLNVPVLLGSATPALESLHNVARQRYRHLQLPQRAGGASEPALQIVDIRNQRLREGLSAALLTVIGKTLAAGEQVLLFINRRGFAPTLICHACGWTARCRHCDSNMVVHRREHSLRCHHCGSGQALVQSCQACGSAPLVYLGLGTERVESALREIFPAIPVLRMDRDSTRRKGALQDILQDIEQGAGQIILGTQMLAKGHHFPNVTLAAVVDADSGLFSLDFRATERLAQLIMQVAGRAGRAEKPGRVLLQTRQPQHPLLITLVREGYVGFARALLQERKLAGLPPFSYQALLRVSAADAQAPLAFLQRLRDLINADGETAAVAVFGPAPAPMLRLAGKYRYQLLLQSGQRRKLHAFLDWLLPQLAALRTPRNLQWSLDVDPVDLY